MKKFLSLLLAIAMLGALSACGSSSSSSTEESTTPASTTAAETSESADASESAETSAEAEEEEEETTAAELSGSVSTNGSTSMESVIGILAEQFMLDNPGVSITYDATGSGTGIEAVNNDTCDIGLSSRALKDEETAEGLVATTVALDGIAIIVNADCPVDDLSVEEIAAIFTGEVTNWSEYGGDGEIACIGREAGSGTRDGFESITGTSDVCVLAQELTSTGAVIEAVKSSSNAIGYASFAAVEGQEGIKVLTVEGVECTEENIADGSYVIQRPFNLVTKDGVELSEAAQAFFDFMTSTDANELILSAGAVPVAE
ncbi:MAG: phosphate ABC transporter substrate-binding protein [Oscillospiraceae bacterium]|nr:phosphate ABC transporter substrate-binding protein [Oscillospiraceae bacterium]